MTHTLKYFFFEWPEELLDSLAHRAVAPEDARYSVMLEKLLFPVYSAH